MALKFHLIFTDVFNVQLLYTLFRTPYFISEKKTGRQAEACTHAHTHTYASAHTNTYTHTHTHTSYTVNAGHFILSEGISNIKSSHLI
jgi:hypothetical protein